MLDDIATKRISRAADPVEVRLRRMDKSNTPEDLTFGKPVDLENVSDLGNLEDAQFSRLVFFCPCILVVPSERMRRLGTSEDGAD